MRERLIQEDYPGDGWKMIVCCILLNQTTNQQVRKILNDLFSLIQSPEVCSTLDPSLISPIIRSTGFSNVKAKRIVEMSKRWISGFSDPRDLPGVGAYAYDSWKIFILGERDISVSDKKLKYFLDSTKNLSIEL